jgi:aryl-alcohol dehydrogenase-like predicted oxidoreductase
MNWGVWDKTSIPKKWKTWCVFRKQNYHLWPCRYLRDYTTEADLKSIFFQQNSTRKITINIKCGIQMVTWNRDNKITTSTLKSTLSGLLRILKNLQTDYLDVFYSTDQVH